MHLNGDDCILNGDDFVNIDVRNVIGMNVSAVGSC